MEVREGVDYVFCNPGELAPKPTTGRTQVVIKREPELLRVKSNTEGDIGDHRFRRLTNTDIANNDNC